MAQEQKAAEQKPAGDVLDKLRAENEALKALLEQSTDPEAKPDTKPEAKPSGSVELAPEVKSVVGALLKAGDLVGLAKLSGVDAKSVDTSSAKLALSRKRGQEAEEKLTQANTLKVECQKEYGAPHKARKAVDKGDFAEAARWVGEALKMDFATFTRKVADATKGMDPKELERFTKDRELKQREEALEAKEKAKETERTEAERVGKATKTIAAKLPDHPAIKLKDGAKLIYLVLEASFDKATGTLGIGYKQAADRVLAEFDENARALGYSKGAAAPAAPVVTKKPEEAPPARTRGKQEFTPPVASKEPDQAQGNKRKGSSLEDRAARAERAHQRNQTR